MRSSRAVRPPSTLSSPALLLTAALLVGTVACGGSDDAAGPVATPSSAVSSTSVAERAADDPGEPEVVCAELRTVQELTDETSAEVADILVAVAEGTGGTEQETLDAFVRLGDDLEAGLPELMSAYDRAADAASAEVATEIRAVADGTAVLTPALAAGFREAAANGEFVDLEEVLGTADLQAASQRAGLASLRLDNFTKPVCGFQISNS